jgi:hypothetical protein
VSENEKTKGKDKRVEEIEKLEAELERSLAVGKVKAAHKQIEETEKQRKRSSAISICNRMVLLLGSIISMLKFLTDAKLLKLPVPEGVASNIEGFEQTYASITYDFQKSLDLGEEAMTKMFPMQKVRKDIVEHAIVDLFNLCSQLGQIGTYCQRLLV